MSDDADQTEQLRGIVGTVLPPDLRDSFVQYARLDVFRDESCQLDTEKVMGHLTAIHVATSQPEQSTREWGQHSGGRSRKSARRRWPGRARKTPRRNTQRRTRRRPVPNPARPKCTRRISPTTRSQITMALPLPGATHLPPNKFTTPIVDSLDGYREAL